MEDCYIFLITYEGQTESVYTWSETSYFMAEYTLKELQAEYPDRVWSIVEKDVS
jgi:hypothetical protein